MKQGKRAVIYTRVSRDDDGTSTTLETQLRKCEGIADLHDYQVLETIKETQSAYNDKRRRPEWDRVIGMAERGEVDVIIAYNMDRMTRSMKELERLILATEEHEVGVITFEGEINLTNEHGRMIARILTAVARAEVERKGARQKRANAQRRAEGQWWSSGWRPFGYTLDGEVVEHEAVMIREAADSVLAGRSLRSIAREWQKSGVSTPRSDKGAEGWTHNGIRNILLNPRRAGLQTYGTDPASNLPNVDGLGAWEPILTQDQHNLLTAYLTNPARATVGKGRKPANLLSGIAICARCEKPVTGGTAEGPQKQRVPVYRCPGHHLSVHREDMDEYVDLLCSYGMDGVLALYTSGAKAEQQAEAAAEIARLRDTMEQAVAAMVNGEMTAETVGQVERAALARIKDLTASIEDEPIVTVLDAAPSMFDQVSERTEVWASLSLDQKRDLLRRHARIRLIPRGRGRRNVDLDDQIEIHFRKDPKEFEEIESKRAELQRLVDAGEAL